MKICHITTSHLPNDSRIFHKELCSLAKRYDDVTLVSGFPDKIPTDRAGVKFVTYRQFAGAKPAYEAQEPDSLRDKRANMRSLFRTAVDLNADLYHCHEIESLLVAVKLKKALGCKAIYDAHEMHSESFAGRLPSWSRRAAIRAIQAFERRYIRRCDFGIAATWKIHDYLAQTLGADRTEALLNVPRPELFEPVERSWDGTLVVCHEGSLTFARGLTTMMEAFALVCRRHPIRLRIVGALPPGEQAWLEQFVRKEHLEGFVDVTGWLEFRMVSSSIAPCHIGLIAMQPLPNHIEAMPNKIFNYMYCGLALVVPGFQVPSRRIVEEERCGLCAEGDSAEAYARAISYLVEHPQEARQMGARAMQAARGKYSWSLAEQKLYAVYDRVLSV